MNNLALLNNKPTRLRVEVKDDHGNPTGEVLEYNVHPLGYSDYGDLQKWINDQYPDPFDSARDAIGRAFKAGHPYNVEQEKFLLKNAAELALKPRHLVGTEEVDALVQSKEGQQIILLTAIRKGDPSFDEEKAARLCKHMTHFDVAKAMLATQYDLMRNDPKAQPLGGHSMTSTNGSSGSRRTRRAAKKSRITG
jgi:hypothetical protein